MNRKKFLKIGGLATVAVSLPAIGLNSNFFYRNAVAAIIQKELGYLRLDADGVRRFASDFVTFSNHFSFVEAHKIRMKITYQYLVRGDYITLGAVEDVVSKFLLSSDFFLNHMDELKSVTYLGLYDPYKRGCTNPFSHHQYPRG